MNLEMKPIVAAATLLMAAHTAPAIAASDPAGDFLASFTGTQSADLDILSASVTFDGTDFLFSSTMNGAISGAPGMLYVWGIDRGAGSARLTLGSPAIGSTVDFDAVAVLFPDGLARAVTFPAMGAPTITPLPGAVTVSGSTISGRIAASLFPSTGASPEDYSFTLWTRLRANPAVDGTNAEVADFSPSLRAAVPEPTTWGLMMLGFGLVGHVLRRGGAPMLGVMGRATPA